MKAEIQPRSELPQNIPGFPDRIIRQAAILTHRSTPTEVFTGIAKHEPITPPPTIFATRTEENAAITTESTIRYMSAGISMSWSDVPSDVVKGVLEEAGTVLGIPVSMLGGKDFTNKFRFLGNRPLNSLYKHAQSAPEREGQDVAGFLLNEVGVRPTTEDVIKATALGKRFIPWERVPQEAIRGLLEQAGEELGVPASLLRIDDLLKKFDFLNGRTLNGLYLYVRGSKDKPEGDICASIIKDAGIDVTAEDVTANIRLGRKTSWERVPREAIYGLLDRAGKELDLPRSMLGNDDYETQFDFLEGNTLVGMYYYHYRHKDRQGKDTAAYISDKAGIEPTPEDLVVTIGNDRRIYWERIPLTAIHGLLETAAAEIGVPLSMLGSDDIEDRPFQFINDHALAGLYEYFNTRSEGQGGMAFLFEKIGVQPTAEDVAKAMQLNRPILWKRVPRNVAHELIQQAANEIGVPISMITFGDLTSKKFEFLGGKSLSGLYAFIDRHGEPNGKKYVDFLLDQMELKPTPEDVIALIKLDNRKVSWERLPVDIWRDLLNRAAQEAGIPLELLASYEIQHKKYAFLGGHSFSGLYHHVRRQREDVNKTVTACLKEKIGVVEIPNGRQNFRKTQMSNLLTELTQGQTMSNLTANKLLPWISNVAEIYKNPYINIEAGEIQNELFVFLSDYIEAGEQVSPESLVSKAHQHLEHYSSNAASRWYKEKSLATPIGDSDLILADMLQDKSDGGASQELIFSRETNATLSSLTPLQRALVLGITIHEQTFDELVAEVNSTFGLQADIDKLEEYFDEALIILRRNLDPREN